MLVKTGVSSVRHQYDDVVVQIPIIIHKGLVHERYIPVIALPVIVGVCPTADDNRITVTGVHAGRQSIDASAGR